MWYEHGSSGAVANLLDFPLASPPPGVVQNLKNPHSRSYQIYVVSAVFLGLTISFLLVRLYAKLYIQRSRSGDDYTCIAALAGLITYISIIIAAESEPSGGKHIWDTTIGDYSNRGFTLQVISVALYGPVIFLVKLTLFLLYLHLFGRLRWLKWLVWIGIAVTACSYLSGFVIAFALCAPPPGGTTWLDMSFKAKCRNGLQDYGVVQGIFGLVTDFYLLFIPVPAVLSLQLPTRKKIGVIAIFMTGFFACIVSTVSLGLRITYNKTLDITWNVVTLYIMTIVEANVGLMVACMPSIATVFRHHGTSIGSFMGRLSSRLRSLTSKRDASYSGPRKRFSPESSQGSRSGRETYIELREGRPVASGPVVV